jgi:hypothetical protein
MFNEMSKYNPSTIEPITQLRKKMSVPVTRYWGTDSGARCIPVIAT